MSTQDNAARLGDLVASRRVSLGYATQEDLARATGLHTRTINGIENARRSASRSTRAILEQALQWQPDSVRAVLDGRQPTPSEGSPTPRADEVDFQTASEAIMTDPQVTQDERAELVRILLKDPSEAWSAYQRLRAWRASERDRGWPWEQQTGI